MVDEIDTYTYLLLYFVHSWPSMKIFLHCANKLRPAPPGSAASILNTRPISLQVDERGQSTKKMNHSAGGFVFCRYLRHCYCTARRATLS